MLYNRLIPKLQMKSRVLGSVQRMVLVTTIEFDTVVEIGDPISQAKIYQAQAADELIFLDLDATQESRIARVEIIRKAAEEIFMPFTVGGGVRSIEDIRLLLSNGADKVSINTAAVENPDMIRQAVERFGSSTIVASIDYKKNVQGEYRVYTRGGRQETHKHPLEWAQECADLGVGEICLTSIERDGRKNGLDIEITERVTHSVSVPVIASGGCGLASHFVDGFKAGASGVAAGTFFSFQDQNFMQTRAHIRNGNVPIRMFT
jgi:imidazole glycerol-phosphate synthase subunit HisF